MNPFPLHRRLFGLFLCLVAVAIGYFTKDGMGLVLTIAVITSFGIYFLLVPRLHTRTDEQEDDEMMCFHRRYLRTHNYNDDSKSL